MGVSVVRKKKEFGMIHVYTGKGKGKTTSSLGLALRAIGHGSNVCIIQFMKGGRYFGELMAAEKFLPKLSFAQFGQACQRLEEIKKGDKCGNCRACFLPFEEQVEQAKKALEYTKKIIKSNKYDLVILDEINVVLSKKQLDTEAVLEIMLSKNPKTELVLTGRGAPTEIKAVADYVTEMREIKHPNTKGIVGRKGVEY